MFMCSNCNEGVAKTRRCRDEGFNNMKSPMRIDDAGLAYNFCPGKATWHDDIVEVLEQCRVAMETGILPTGGNIDEQPELFVEVFPTFVDRWKARQYQRIWVDVSKFTEAVLKNIAGMFGAKS